MNATPKPSAQTYSTGARLFIVALAFSYLAAFVSFFLQADGLIGPHGILPAAQFFPLAREQLGHRAWLEIPSLCWILGTGAAIKVLCIVGAALSVGLLAGLAPAVCIGVMWACYLSLASAGQIFFDFQWDALLLEASLVAVFLVPWTVGLQGREYDPPRMARLLAWWLLFRLMFFSGLVKLTSGDPTWRHLTALSFHFQTQPLPTWVAWYANRLPLGAQKAACALMFAIEFLAPMCLLGPRKIRHVGALTLIFLQAAIALTGNYAFFNLLSIGLCLTCFDDDWWRSLRWGVPEIHDFAQSRPAKASILRWFAAFSVGITFFENFAGSVHGAADSPLVRDVVEAVSPLRSFNVYGLFAVMTIERPELIIEGSDDGRNWEEYGLPYKPGNLHERPRWVAPLQPRLDWQLWFAALDQSENSPWVSTLCERLLRGEGPVLGLFAHNPFPLHPPKMIRVVRYRYDFTSGAERARSGDWWKRTPIDFYILPISLPSSPK